MTQEFFFKDISQDKITNLVDNSLSNVDDGELFLEYCQSESLAFDDGTLRSSSFDISQGFGLRAVLGDVTAYSHSSEINAKAIQNAASTVQAVRAGYDGNVQLSSSIAGAKQQLYSDINPISGVSFEVKVKILQDIDKYLRDKDSRVRQVSASIAGQWQSVCIVRRGGEFAYDIRPLVRLNISLVMEENGRMESGSYGGGGRAAYDKYIDITNWQKYADEAYKQALNNLVSVPIKAGEMDVVLSPGWPGIILHEAIGHGLEGDCNRKKTSTFCELMGKEIATKNVTVVDDGTIADRRGSLTIDDEGTPTQCTTLIEDGILCSYMHDRLSARVMGCEATGNGRRESYEFPPIPRMTNTYMLGRDGNKSDIVSSVKDGIYAVAFGGGQVDTTSGKFVFSASEAYRIENGKIAEPVKGVTLIGDGATVLKNIAAVGDDMDLDAGIGTCGKDGQGVPVGVGQPTILVNNVTVGGTEI